MRKTAISVPSTLLAQIDRAAHQRGESRSRFIQRLLSEAIRAKNDADFTQRLNAFFEEAGGAEAYRKEIERWELSPSWAAERW